jgi:hypothetical protein
MHLRSLLLALTVPLGCATVRDRPNRGDVPLTFTNHSQRDVCGLHLAPADARLWGKSRLTDIVRVGEQTSVPVEPGRYMLRAHACNAASTVLVLYDVDVTAAHEVVLHEPETREDPAPGRTAWPVTRWLSEASDWYYPTGLPGPGPGPRVTVASSCTHDVRLRLGDRETTTLPAQASIRLALPTGTAVALVDADHHELTRHTTTTGKQYLRIDAACRTIAHR